MGQLTFLLLCVLPAAMLFSESCASTTDMTLQDGAGGKDVVDAVLGKLRENCIFSDDRLFMRRLAYVETRDGTLYDTYSTSYNGGIWKVDENMFKATQTCPNYISTECSLLRASSQFQNLEWTKATWSDLRKPLYSGVASALYMLLQLRKTSQQMPGEVEGQASIWATLYRPGSSSLLFSQGASNATDLKCRGKMDVAFVMDSSGSVSRDDFTLTLQFAAAVSQALPVGVDEARVGMVVFSSTARVEMYLKDHSSSAALAKAILATQYMGGGTSTFQALNLTRTQLFSSANGARSGVRRVTILLTDGMSSSMTNTANSARLLKEEGSIIYAVGIGGYYLPELQAVASQPVCSHVFTLDKFSYITAILTEIQKSTCEATIVIPPDEEVEGKIPEEGSDDTIETEEPGQDEHVEVDVDCGEVDAYVSYKNSNPGPALYDEFKKAVHRQPARLGMGSRSSGSGRMYVRLIARRLSRQEAAEKNCDGYNYTVGSKPNPPPTTRPPTTTQRPTTTLPPTTTKPPTDSGLPGCYPSPCTPENIAAQRFYFPYTLDISKFIQCDAFGKTFLMSCPAGLVWNQVNYACSWPRRR